MRRLASARHFRRLVTACTLSICALGSDSQALEQAPERIVALGTSLTASPGYVEALPDFLQAYCGVRPSVLRVARAGETSLWGLGQVEAVIAIQPDIVLVEFAINDSALNRLVSLRRSEAAMRALIETLRTRLPAATVVVMTMNPTRGWRGLIRPWRQRYEERHRAIAVELGGLGFDLGDAWVKLSDRDLETAIPDGLHPTRESAQRIVAPAIAQRIAEAKCGFRNALP